MKFNSSLLIIVAGLAILSMQSSLDSRGKVPVASKAGLQVTTNILAEESCSPDHFSMRLQFTVQNVGKETVLLHKRTAASRILVSDSQAAARKKRYRQVLRYDDPGDTGGFENPVLSEFTILKHGDRFEFEENVSIYLYNAVKPSEQFFSEGTYFLQLVIGTWPYIADPKPFRKKWKDKGYLWYQGLTSEPMSFTIEKNRPLTKCM